MSKIRQDDAGLYVVAGGYIGRPGNVRGYSHTYDMSDGNLKSGDTVKARHVAGEPLIKLKLDNGQVLRWYTVGRSWKAENGQGNRL